MPGIRCIKALAIGRLKIYAIARKAVDAIRAIVAYIGVCGLVAWHKIRIFVSPMNRINANK